MDIRIDNLQDLINILEQDDYEEILTRYLYNRHRLASSTLLNRNYIDEQDLIQEELPQEQLTQESTQEQLPQEQLTQEELEHIDQPPYITTLLNNLNNPDPNFTQYIRSIEIDHEGLNNLPVFFPNIDSNETIDISELANNMINDLTNNNLPQENINRPLSIDGHSKLNEYRVWTSLEGSCCICQEEYRWLDKVVELPCKHKFHSSCIHKWFTNRSTCPICRYDLNPSNDNDSLIRNILNLSRYVTNILEYGARNFIN